MSNGRIVVMGGDGFVGSEICRLAVETRYEVVSLSRSNRHPHLGGWAQSVDWVKINVFDAEEWRSYFKGADAVIDCIGIAVENPLQPDSTYARVNEDSAKLIARVADEMGVPRFVYISASPQAAFVLPRAYITSKQHAEDFVQRTNAHWAVLRPSFIYGWGRLWSMLPGRGLRTMAQLPVLKNYLAEVSPLRVEVVAAAALRAAVEPNVAGLLSVPEIARLGASRLRDWQVAPVAQVA